MGTKLKNILDGKYFLIFYLLFFYACMVLLQHYLLGIDWVSSFILAVPLVSIPITIGLLISIRGKGK